jgi:hypothetical protein
LWGGPPPGALGGGLTRHAGSPRHELGSPAFMEVELTG